MCSTRSRKWKCGQSTSRIWPQKPHFTIVGTMINIGTGKINLADFEKIIDSKDRSQAGFSVPAHGLYLTKIEYKFLNAIGNKL